MEMFLTALADEYEKSEIEVITAHGVSIIIRKGFSPLNLIKSSPEDEDLEEEELDD